LFQNVNDSVRSHSNSHFNKNHLLRHTLKSAGVDGRTTMRVAPSMGRQWLSHPAFDKGMATGSRGVRARGHQLLYPSPSIRYGRLSYEGAAQGIAAEFAKRSNAERSKL
jgi:hypothetical protein